MMNVDEALMRSLGLDQFEASLANYEAYYLTKDQMRHRGPQAYVSANTHAIRSPKVFEDLLFRDKTFSKYFLTLTCVQLLHL